jgi:pimeloyl-ACP methyl ester carboxylesterase
MARLVSKHFQRTDAATRASRSDDMSNATIKPDRAPVTAATPINSFSPVVLQMPGRQADLQLRVSAPATGDKLPILLFSHGFGRSNFIASFRGYGPLVDFYAAHGFVVIQPTHQSSKTLGLDPDGPEGPLFWKSRPKDMSFIIDHLDEIEAAVPGLRGRLDKTRIAAVGHSMGGHTVAMLAGMRVTDPKTGEVVDLTETRITNTVIFASPGRSESLAEWASEHYPVLGGTDFSVMKRPALVVAGDKDASAAFSAQKDWRADAYALSPGPKCLLTVYGGGHMLGGISGYDAAETTDEDPQRVAGVQWATWAYLRTAFCPDDSAWSTVINELKDASNSFGKIACK